MMSMKPERDVVLTQEQKDMLFFIFQGEKVARDVYMILSKIYKNESTFALMKYAEQRDVDLARELCNTYDVKTTEIDEDTVGKFESQVLQTLYDECIEKGKRSLLDALEVGEFLETTDIEDLEQTSVGMPSNVVDVYNKLMRRNKTHLSAFQAAILKAA